MGPAMEMQAQGKQRNREGRCVMGDVAMKEKKGKLRILQKPEKNTYKFPPNFFTTAIIH